MTSFFRPLFFGAFLAALPGTLMAGDEECRAAMQRGVEMVTKAATRWQQHKTCFSCHHQTLPMLAVTEAARAGLPADNAWLKSQADTTYTYFEERIATMNEGGHVPGGAATAGYGLWALALNQRAPDATTTAIIHYLLQIQGVQTLKKGPGPDTQPHDGRWIASCRRAPLQATDIGDTVLVLLGMEKYATAEQGPKVAAARILADKYLTEVKLRHQQDRLWLLWGLHLLGGDAAAETKVREAILKAQLADGGWAQTDAEKISDAYSTGQTLFMLCQTGTGPGEPLALRARDYLIKTQHEDGSWLVESRLKYKAQPYFENGDPYGEHQFLSTAATCWATAALAQLLPRPLTVAKP